MSDSSMNVAAAQAMFGEASNTVFVHPADGERIRLICKLSDTVLQLKQQLASTLLISAADLAFFHHQHSEEEILDSNSLSFYSFANGARVPMLIRQSLQLSPNSELDLADITFAPLYFEKICSFISAKDPPTPLTTLSMCTHQIPDSASAASLAAVLLGSRTIQSISIRPRSGVATDSRFDLARWSPLIQSFCSMRALASLNISGVRICDASADILAAGLRTTKTLTQLDASHCQLSDVGLTAIAKSLPANFSLRNLLLAHNNFGDAGAFVLGQALRTSWVVQVVNLSHNRVGAAGASALFEAALRSTSMLQMELDGCKVGSEAARDIAAAIRTSATLTSFSISGAEFDDEAFMVLAPALQVNTRITRASLRHCGCGDQGALELSAALRYNQTLTELDLSHNLIGDVGFIGLLAATHHTQALTFGPINSNGQHHFNTKLTSLILHHNQIGSQIAAMRAFGTWLRGNRTLFQLDLSSNRFDTMAAETIAICLPSNLALRTFKLADNQDIGDTGALALADARRMHCNDLEYEGPDV